MEDLEEKPRPVLQMKRPKNRKTKTVLIFDEDARREYLTGFHKRKNQRRKKAKLENEKKLKDEKQALKQKVRDMVHKSDRHRLPEVEEFLQSTVHELPEHTVTITDMSDTLTAATQPEASPEPQDDRLQEEEDGEEEEDSDALKKKRKKLINKLAQIGNNPGTSKKKLKRLGKGKFRGGGGGGGKSSGGGGGSGGGKKSWKNKKSGGKKHRHRQT